MAVFLNKIDNMFFSYKKPEETEDFQAYISDLHELSIENKQYLKHQTMLTRYLSGYTPYQSLLVFHETGSGKSALCVSVFQELYRFHKGQLLFIYMVNNNSAKKNFRDELDKFLSDQKDYSQDKIYIILYSNEEIQRLKNRIESFVNEKKLPIFIVIDEAHNLVTNETIEVKNPDKDKIDMLSKYMEDTEGKDVEVSRLKTIMKTGYAVRHNTITNKEKILNNVIQCMRDKSDKNHTYIYKWELKKIMRMQESDHNTSKSKKEEKYNDILNYVDSFESNGFQIPIMDIIHRLGRYYHKRKKTTKELVREVNDYLYSVHEDQKVVAKKDIDMIIQQEQCDKRYVAVENLLRSFLSKNDKTILVMSATPMCHTIEEVVPLLNLINDKPENKIELNIFKKENWREILAEKIKGKVSFFKRSKVGTGIDASFQKGNEKFDDYNKNMFHNVFFQEMEETQSKEYLNALLSPNKSLSKHIHRHAIISDEKNSLKKRLTECNGDISNMLHCIKEYSIIYYTIINQLLNEPHKRTFIYGKYILDNVKGFSGLSGFCDLLEYFNIKRYRNFEKDYQQGERFFVQLFDTDNEHDGIHRTFDDENEMKKINNQQLVRDFNQWGKINVIIGSDASSEALTFLDIQSIHVVDAWWNLARAHQVLGRGIRHRSHDRLKKRKRFHDIFLKSSRDKRYFYELLTESVKRTIIQYLDSQLLKNKNDIGGGDTQNLSKLKMIQEQIQSDRIVDIKVINIPNDMKNSRLGKGYDFFIQFGNSPLEIYHIVSSEVYSICDLEYFNVLYLNDTKDKQLRDRYLKLQRKYAGDRSKTLTTSSMFTTISRNSSKKSIDSRSDREKAFFKEYKQKENDALKYKNAYSLYEKEDEFFRIIYYTCYCEDVKGISFEDWTDMMTENKNNVDHHLIPIKNIQDETCLKRLGDNKRYTIYDIKDIPLHIYLHCALPNMDQYNAMVTKIMERNGKLLDSQRIYQLHQYMRASEREKEICNITGFLIEHSIDLYLNDYDYSKDLYLSSFYKERLETKKRNYRPNKKETNYEIIDSAKNSVLEFDPVYQNVRAYIISFFKERNNNAIMLSLLWNHISKNCRISNKTQFKRYILKLRSTKVLFYKMGYIKLNQNDTSKIFDYHDSILNKRVPSAIEYNLDNIKERLNISDKLQRLNHYCKLEEDNDDLDLVGRHLFNNDENKRGQKRSLDVDVENLIETLPLQKKHKILRHTMMASSSTTTTTTTTSSSFLLSSSPNQKQSIIDCLLKDSRYIELDESLQRIMIGIVTNDKYYIYILNDNLEYSIKQSSVISEMKHFLTTFIKKNKNSHRDHVNRIENLFKESLNGDNNLVEQWERHIYPSVMHLLKHMESLVVSTDNSTNVTSSFTELSFQDKIKYASTQFDDIISKDDFIHDRKDKIFARLKKKLVDYASLESKSEFIQIKKKKIEGTTFYYQISIWILLMRINCALGITPFDKQTDDVNKTKRTWILFFKKYLIDKRIESTGRDINTLFFPNMYELLTDPSFFSTEDLLPIQDQLDQYVSYTESNSTKTQMLQGVKVKNWRTFVKNILEKKKLVFRFKTPLEPENCPAPVATAAAAEAAAADPNGR